MLEKIIPDFLIYADNVYRTDNYIVKQVLEIVQDEIQNNSVVSHDTYYRRTMKRDLAYNMMFMDKVKVNGKRLPSTQYTRTYIE